MLEHLQQWSQKKNLARKHNKACSSSEAISPAKKWLVNSYNQIWVKMAETVHQPKYKKKMKILK